MKLSQIINSKTALETLLKNSLPISISWDLMKFVKVASTELATFEELKNKKIRELGEEILIDNKPSGNIKVKDENMQEFIKLIDELVNKDIEIKVPQIKISDLSEYKDVNGNGISITPADLMALDWLIVD